METLIRKTNSGTPLSFDEARTLFNAMLAGELTEAQIAATLIALRLRGERPQELAALVTAMNERKRRFLHRTHETIDTCGTGGDGKSTVNVSTAVGIILAALGYRVLKHGNSAQSGLVGSADILADLGFDLSYAGTTPEEFYQRHNFVFMMAPLYHPALKDIGKVRREIKIPTIFNFAGPLANPGDPDCQIIGIGAPDRLAFVAEALRELGRDHVTVYASEDGYDEISSADRTRCLTINGERMDEYFVNPGDFFTPCPMPVVASRHEARELFLAGLSGTNQSIADIFSLNTALAMHTMNGSTLDDGFARARGIIADGMAMAKLTAMTGATA